MYEKKATEAHWASAVVPRPSGYKILVAMPTVKEKTEGGVIRPDSLRKQEEVASIFGVVVTMGPDAYKDEGKFPSGPWCKEGDWVVMRSYTGTRFKIQDQEFRLINDDSVEAVVEDPEHIARAF
jgi:co-chaperonin GroES (HSP10)